MIYWRGAKRNRIGETRCSSGNGEIWTLTAIVCRITSYRRTMRGCIMNTFVGRFVINSPELLKRSSGVTRSFVASRARASSSRVTEHTERRRPGKNNGKKWDANNKVRIKEQLFTETYFRL